MRVEPRQGGGADETPADEDGDKALRAKTLSRASFLYLSFTASAGALVYGCRPEWDRTSPTRDEPAAIELNRRGGDVWTWKKRVTGACVHSGRCAALYLRVADRRIEVEKDGDRFAALVPLGEGASPLVAVCEHRDGRRYSSREIVYYQRLRDLPVARIRASIEDGEIFLDASGSEPGGGAGSPISGYEWSVRESNPADVSPQEPGAERTSLTSPPEEGEYYVSLRVADEAGGEDTSTAYFVVEDGEPKLPDLRTGNPAWVDGAIVYGVIPRNFGPEGIRSVTGKLDYLRDLGINTIWLAPINPSPPDDFGYAVTDYFELRPYDGGGTKADFRELVREAHRRDIRVVMDFIPNHTSVEHPYFLDAQEHGEASAYYDFYDRDAKGDYTYYFGYDHLANLNYDNPEVERFMLEAFGYWVREFDVDGFRVDMAWAVRERAPGFWPRWRRELQRIKPDLLLLAEASARDPYFFSEGFDAAYDWTEGPGDWAWSRVFGDPARLTSRLDAALTNEGTGYHPDALIFRFLNNNDTGERFASRYGEGVTRVAAALLLTLPGLPCLYTGDEVGAEFEPYDEGPPISWRDKYGLRDYYKSLITLRKEIPSLRSRSWTPLTVEPAGSVYGYLRYVEPAEQPVIVLLNWYATDLEAKVEVPEQFRFLTSHATLRDVLADERVRPGDALRVPMRGHSARVLTISED